MPQAERQLLLLRQSNVNPNILSYAQIYGLHDYNAAPFVPIGMETPVHEKPKRRGTFAEHCSIGYVLGTAFENYCLLKMWMKATRATQISATVFHKHKYITNPGVTPEDRVMTTAGKLMAELKGRMANNLRETELKQLEQLWTILKYGWTQKDNQQQTPPSAPPRQTSQVQVALTQKVRYQLPIPVIVLTLQIPL